MGESPVHQGANCLRAIPAPLEGLKYGIADLYLTIERGSSKAAAADQRPLPGVIEHPVPAKPSGNIGIPLSAHQEFLQGVLPLLGGPVLLGDLCIELLRQALLSFHIGPE